MEVIMAHIRICTALLLFLVTLSACQSNNSSEGGLGEPGVDVVLGAEGPDSPPGECLDDGSEGTSDTLGC